MMTRVTMIRVKHHGIDRIMITKLVLVFATFVSTRKNNLQAGNGGQPAGQWVCLEVLHKRALGVVASRHLKMVFIWYLVE